MWWCADIASFEYYCDLIVLRQVSNEVLVPSYQQTTLTWQAGHVSPVRINTLLICHNPARQQLEAGIIISVEQQFCIQTSQPPLPGHIFQFSCMQPCLKIPKYPPW